MQCVTIRYDSTYAANMTRGLWKPKRNKALIRKAQAALLAAEQAGVAVRWQHVKGHSNDRWNNRADELAGLAAAESAPVPATTDVTEGEGFGTPLIPVPLTGVAVRWVQWEPTESARVLRARTRFGALNLRVPSRTVPPLEIRKKSAEALRAIATDRRQGSVDSHTCDRAKNKVMQAAKELSSIGFQRLEIAARRRPSPPTHTLDCDIDGEQLNAFLSSDAGTDYRKYTPQVSAALSAGKVGLGGKVRLRLQYDFSELGRDLFEAGHVSHSREYARGPDPFKWPRALRKVALGTVKEADDAAAFPRARLAMDTDGREIGEDFIRNREEILLKFGAFLFPGCGPGEQRERMKVITTAYDMGASPHFWTRLYGQQDGRRLTTKRVRVGETRKVFSMEKYRLSLVRGAENFAAKSQRMLQFLSAPGVVRKGRGQRTPKNVALTLKSYLLQEAEGVGREAKLRWCSDNGVRVCNLQHDGVGVHMEAAQTADAASAMTAAVTQACGYSVEVVVK